MKNEESDIEKSAGATVLYIEDNVPNIELVEMILNTQRPEVRLTTVMNGKKAVSLAAKCKADLILLNLNVPGLSGEEILSELKANQETNDTPVVIISADVTPKHREDLLSAGAAHFLTMPLIMKDFLDIVDRFTI